MSHHSCDRRDWSEVLPGRWLCLRCGNWAGGMNPSSEPSTLFRSTLLKERGSIVVEDLEGQGPGPREVFRIPPEQLLRVPVDIIRSGRFWQV